MVTPDVHTIAVPGGTLRVTTEFTPHLSPRPGPPPTVISPRLFGVHTALTPAVKVLYPGSAVTRPFIAGVQTVPGDLTTLVERACRASWNAGLTPCYSMKLDPEQVAAGRWDTPIEELAAWHAGQPAAKLIQWHEPEDDFTGLGFSRYFNRLADHIRAVNTGLPLIYSAMGYQWAPGATGSIQGRTDTPADWRVDADLRACDVYSGRSFPLTAILPEHPGFKRWFDLLAGDAPYGVTERGFTTVSALAARAATIRREAAWLNTSPLGLRCQVYIYWATTGVERDAGLLLGDEGSRTAVQDLVGGPAPRNPGTPVP